MTLKHFRYFLNAVFAIAFSTNFCLGQKANNAAKVNLEFNARSTTIYTQKDGSLVVTVAAKDEQKWKTRGYITYKDFGAVADGKHDDIDAISAAHALANEKGLAVKANNNAIFYIGGKARTAIIQTNTDFGDASFIIDDTDVQSPNTPVFLVASTMQSFPLSAVKTLHRGQENIGVQLDGPALVSVTNNQVRHYIRYGLNQNNGDPQTDIFMVDKNGNVDKRSPIIWDFEHISNITALPMDEDTLCITGGTFTTIANKGDKGNGYYARNIAIKRTHVTVSGITHLIQEEGEKGAPYGGFISVSECANVTVKNSTLTGHKTYSKIGNAGKPVAMGTYDITINKALNVAITNCRQTNDIDDKRFWGIMASNYSKNLLYDSVVFSRFDAHKGVANATIRNSTLGHMGINAIGTGTLLVENCTIRGNTIVNLRSDYGSTWEGDFIIRNCTFFPAAGKPHSAALIGGSNSGLHNFGYECMMPHTITISNLTIDDSAHPNNYNGPVIFANFNSQMKDESYKQTFPYKTTGKVILQDVVVKSGKPLNLSVNDYMFKEVSIINQ